MKIIILPGLDGTGTLHTEVTELLTPQHDVIIVAYPPDVVSYQALMKAVRSSLPNDEYLIVAESFSGPLATAIAAEKPTGLRGVVFVATFARTPIKAPKVLTYIAEILPTRFLMSTRLVQTLLMGKWSTPEFTAKFMQAMKAVPVSTVAGRLREVLKIDTAHMVSRIEVPTTYLAAKNDKLVYSKMALDFERAYHTTIEVDGPHFLLQANPEMSSEHILEFAAQLK